MNTYAATIMSITKEQADVLPILNYEVNFTQNNNPFSTVNFRTSDPSQNTIDNLIAQQIATYQQKDAEDEVAANPMIGPVTLPTQTSLSPQQIYFQELSVLEQLQIAINAGVTSAQTDYANQQTIVNKLYQTSFYVS